MSVFEYPSILLAAVLGHSIVLLFDKVTYAHDHTVANEAITLV